MVGPRVPCAGDPSGRHFYDSTQRPHTPPTVLYTSHHLVFKVRFVHPYKTVAHYYIG